MATTVSSVAAPKPATPQLSYCSKLARLTEVILQIAIRVLFIGGSILMAAAAFSLNLHTIALPVVAFGSTILASFFFPPKNLVSGPYFDLLPPLLRPIQGAQARPQMEPLPVDAPRGLINLSQNCPFNSLVHFLEGVPGIAEFLRHPLTPQTTMQQFQSFMARYHPSARLMADFAVYAAAQNPKRPVPAMFTDFIENYVPPAGDSSFRKIQEVYRNLNHLHGTYAHFLADYDQAVRENRTPVAGTQNLRLAMSRMTPRISPSELDQEDAPEILTQILSILPDEYKVRIEQATRYAVGEHPIIELPDGRTSRKEDRIGYFTLELKEGIQSARLGQLYDNFRDYDVEHHPTYQVEKDGVMFTTIDPVTKEPVRKRYSSEHTTIRIMEAPPVLFFQIKRFYRNNETAKSWWSWLIPSWFPTLTPRTVKRDIPVEIPDELTIDIADGTQRRYRLVTYINQWGSSIDRGHYTAAGKKNERKFFMNDQLVTLADQPSWDERALQAYLLGYVPVP